jgi:hypothetical protein
VAQHAALRGDAEARAHLVQQVEQAQHGFHVVGGGVDADAGVAGAEQEAVQDGGGHAARVVGRVVGLQADGKRARPADRVVEARLHPALGRHGDEVAPAHQLGHGGHHLRRQRRAERQRLGRGGQQPVAQAADRQVGERREARRVMPIEDEAADVVRLVGNHLLVQEVAQRQVGQGALGRHALGRAGGGDAGQRVAGAGWAGAGEQAAEVLEDVAGAADRVPERHPPGLPDSPPGRKVFRNEGTSCMINQLPDSAPAAAADWPDRIYDLLKKHEIRQVALVPDAGHSRLIRRCLADNELRVVTLTTEEEGVAMLQGAWLGGQKGVLLMQSSGVGNCINMLSLSSSTARRCR